MPPAVKSSPEKPKLSIPRRILALLRKTPGELVPYAAIWELWNTGSPFYSHYYLGTMQTCIGYARKQLKSGCIRNVRDYGYIYFES